MVVLFIKVGNIGGGIGWWENDGGKMKLSFRCFWVI